MKKQLPVSLFRKYLSGQCTPEEEALIEEWYASSENDEDYTTSMSGQQKLRLKDNIRQSISDKISTETNDPMVLNKRSKVRQLIWATTGIAASLLIIFAVIRHEHTTVNTNVAVNEAISIFNKTNIISETTLSDGSHVWLMPGASLQYHKLFSANRREINLSGEAFFEVTKNPARPFIIYSRNLITKVWGTSFRVRDSKELAFADVTVMTGKVSVKLVHPGNFPKNSDAKSNANEVMIYPSQQVTYLKKDQSFVEKPKADMTAMLIWKKPDITFNNRPMREVIPVLNKTFNVNISASESNINSLLLTADLNGLNFPEIMQMLHKALGINYDINGQNIELKTDNNQ
jgi:ferric-dicitrate binding protein FerR (iron transport regulator)